MPKYKYMAVELVKSSIILCSHLDGGCDQHCRRPSVVYDTHQRTKWTVPETLSSSRDMVLPAKI